MRFRRIVSYCSLVFSTVLVALLTSSCGYRFQTSQDSSLAEAGITKIYLAAIQNQSFKPGIEQWIYSAVQRTLIVGDRVKIVSSREQADAILDGTILDAYYAMSPSGAASSNAIFPTERKVTEMIVATEFQAVIKTEFRLTKTDSAGASPIWATQLQTEKRFPGSYQKQNYGTTSSLINESEFDRAVREMVNGMAKELHEALLAQF